MEFINPTGFWDYSGDFSIELQIDTDTDFVPQGVIAAPGNGKKLVFVKNGSIKQTMGGIQFYSNSHEPFTWGYKFIRCIRKDDNSLLWVNSEYAKKITQ